MQHFPHDCLAIIFSLSAPPAVRALKYTCKWISATTYADTSTFILHKNIGGMIWRDSEYPLQYTKHRCLSAAKYIGIGDGYGLSCRRNDMAVEMLIEYLDKTYDRTAVRAVIAAKTASSATFCRKN